MPQLAVMVILCAVFIGVSTVLGWVNLRRLDQIFLAALGDRARVLARDFESTFRRNYDGIVQADETVIPVSPDGGAGDGRSLQEAFLIDLTTLARQVDEGNPSSPADPAALDRLREPEDLAFLGLYDREGRPVRFSGQAPADASTWVAPVAGGQDEVRIDLFSRFFRGEPFGCLAVGRKGGGAVLLALDDAGFRRRAARFAVRQSLTTLGSETDLLFAVVTDAARRRVGVFDATRPEAVSPGRPADLPSGGTASVREVAVPLRSGALAGELRLGFRGDALEELLGKNRRGILLSALFMVIIGVLAAVFLHRNQQAHLRQLREMERRVYQAERLSALGRLAGGMAHEIRNPLNAISMAVQTLGMETPGKLTRTIQEEIRRLDRLLDDFLCLARNRLVFRPGDLAELLDAVTELLREEAEARGVRLLGPPAGEPIPLVMDADKMKQAVLNLLKNALEAIRGEGTVRLEVRRPRKGRVEVTVSDTGVGLGAEEIPRIFDLDYTTKDKGVGLGLPIAREIILGHGGEITVESAPGQGTTFRVLLPLEPLDPALLDARPE
ncbi:MAG: hypothetical protein KA419_02680 [Acidobacteria bacterium]|nr:hypothetical protein [Acidobacteriota bacterium]